MNEAEQDIFIEGLSAKDAIQIVGLTQAMETAVRTKLATLSKAEGDCYTAQFKGDTR